MPLEAKHEQVAFVQPMSRRERRMQRANAKRMSQQHAEVAHPNAIGVWFPNEHKGVSQSRGLSMADYHQHQQQQHQRLQIEQRQQGEPSFSSSPSIERKQIQHEPGHYSRGEREYKEGQHAHGQGRHNRNDAQAEESFPFLRTKPRQRVLLEFQDVKACVVTKAEGYCKAFKRSPELKENASQVRVLLNSVGGCIYAGKLHAILGGSGAGKTTLLNVLSGRPLGEHMSVSGRLIVNDSNDRITSRQVGLACVCVSGVCLCV
jgi:ABC-type glutathione transport system ATPase component